MTMWHTLSARFTDEETAVIRKYAKKQGMTENELIRAGVHTIVQIVAMEQVHKNPNLSTLQGFSKELKEESESLTLPRGSTTCL